MKLESRADEILDRRTEVALEGALSDVLSDARRTSEHRTNRFAKSLRTTPIERTPDGFEARIGSPLSSARAKEKGAFITPKRGEYLVFDAGDGVRKVKSVRLRPAPVVTPASKRFGGYMTQRLIEASR